STAVPVLQPSSDSGVSNSDGLTNVKTPVFTVAGAPYFRFYRNGTQVSADFQTGSTFVSAVLTDGTYAFAVVAMDAAGNASPVSAMASITIDTHAPANPSGLALQAASDSGVSN